MRGERVACTEREPELASCNFCDLGGMRVGSLFSCLIALSLCEVLAEVGVLVRLCLKGASNVIVEELMKKENEK